MARKAMFGWVVGMQLVLMALASRSEAALGCVNVGPPTGNIATCTVDEDCLAVGGIGCSAPPGFCVCGIDPELLPCPCIPSTAPALSHGILIGLAGLLTAAGLILLWRRAGGSERDLAQATRS